MKEAPKNISLVCCPYPHKTEPDHYFRQHQSLHNAWVLAVCGQKTRIGFHLAEVGFKLEPVGAEARSAPSEAEQSCNSSAITSPGRREISVRRRISIRGVIGATCAFSDRRNKRPVPGYASAIGRVDGFGP